MRRTTFAGLSTVSALVLLFSYHTSTSASVTTASSQIAAAAPGATSSSSPSPTTSTAAPSTSSATGAGSATSSSATKSSSPSTTKSSASSAAGTYTGTAVDTRWGVVQVRITVKGGKITAAEAVQYPQENPRDEQINAYAVPELNHEVVAAQSGSIDAVSGATVTSDGYIQSLQSAIDEAHL